MRWFTGGVLEAGVCIRGECTGGVKVVGDWRRILVYNWLCYRLITCNILYAIVENYTTCPRW